jgi:hypothetical protein
VVTICTTSLTFTILRSAHTLYLCFVWISERTAIISLYSTDWLVFYSRWGVFTARYGLGIYMQFRWTLPNYLHLSSLQLLRLVTLTWYRLGCKWQASTWPKHTGPNIIISTADIKLDNCVEIIMPKYKVICALGSQRIKHFQRNALWPRWLSKCAERELLS